MLAPAAHRFAKHLVVSQHADVLLFYFGWMLRVPWLGALALRLPLLPRIAALLATRLPRRPVRGRTCDYACEWEGCDVAAFTSERSAAAADAYCARLWGEGFDRKRRRIRATSALLRRLRET